jgi:DNA mismatch repair protein MutL
MSPILMVPVTVKTDEETATLLEENGELLTDLGFELEPYGDNSHIIRAVPADMYESDVTAAFEEICQQLKDHRTVDLEARKTNILKTVACKAAIKAGWKTDVRELFVLAEAVVSQKIKYCPHGRPVAVVYTREDLDKEFKRIV